MFSALHAGALLCQRTIKDRLDAARDPPCNGAMPDDPTRRQMRPREPVPVTPAYGAVTFGHVALEGGVLCDECRACAKRTALTKQECPAIRIGNGKFVLHATFKCSKCGADKPRLYQATKDEAAMFLAGDRLGRQIGP